MRDQNIRLFVRREDLNHPFVSGNKWWKLKYNLEDARSSGEHTLLTFGGAYSNHIYATAAAAREMGLKSIGVIRGEQVVPLNPTLQFAASCGMRLYHVSRQAYREKSKESFADALRSKFGRFFLIPEGGSNLLAVKGIAEFASTIEEDFDYLCCPVGTGGTLAGLIEAFGGTRRILGFAALKEDNYLVEEVRRLGANQPNWELITKYHFGGYAKSTPALLTFISAFHRTHQVPLEPIYTGKMMFGIMDMVKNQFFKKGSTVLAIHTGGIR